MTTLADFIRQSRLEAGFKTQASLADAAKVDREVVNRIERGKTLRPEAYVRRRLASALGVSHLDLLVAAGEITREELGTSVGVVEVDPNDPREAFIERIRKLRWTEGVNRGMTFAVGVLEREQGIETGDGDQGGSIR